LIINQKEYSQQQFKSAKLKHEIICIKLQSKTGKGFKKEGKPIENAQI